MINTTLLRYCQVALHTETAAGGPPPSEQALRPNAVRLAERWRGTASQLRPPRR